MSRPAKMRVVIVEPGQYAREAEIDNTLEAEQAVVGGLIDVICPWLDDKACLILNDEGKLIPLEPNRDLPEYEDVVFGTFFICGDGGEDFCSLTDEQVKRYLKRFRQPEVIFDTPAGFLCAACSPQGYKRYMEAVNGGKGPNQPNRKDEPSR